MDQFSASDLVKSQRPLPGDEETPSLAVREVHRAYYIACSEFCSIISKGNGLSGQSDPIWWRACKNQRHFEAMLAEAEAGIAHMYGQKGLEQCRQWTIDALFED